jgi:bifunctional dethiobiotin synthetase / adenosylmethionine---8-amino-7-oxononanoate aminotransferase
VRNVSARTLYQFSKPLSPHIAARLEAESPEDEQIQLRVHEELNSYAAKGDGIGIIETAGGVLSPGPSGNVQADIYRPLRLPALLVGDHRLGGIAATLSAFESLHLRGYDLSSVVLFEDDILLNINKNRNHSYLQDYFNQKHGHIQVFGIPAPPEKAASLEEDAKAMQDYYDRASESKAVLSILQTFEEQHQERVSDLKSMAEQAHEKIWYPFTQHQGRTKKDIIVIDSAYGDDFASLSSENWTPASNTQQASSTPSRATESDSGSILQPAMDGSASWWTQGLGHGNPELSLAAAYAAGRYGHVMFASAINEPAMKLVKLLLDGHQNPRLAKVYFTDNGSTGMEVAIKMGLRAACQRYGWDHNRDDIKILGFRGSYHGDTMGVMDASEPSVYNAKVEWYQPRGCTFRTLRLSGMGEN